MSGSPAVPLAQKGLLPPGWVAHKHTADSGREYPVYVGPTGERVYSRVAAWRAADTAFLGFSADSDEDDESGSDPEVMPVHADDRALNVAAAVCHESHFQLPDDHCERSWKCTFGRGHPGLCSTEFPSHPRRRPA